MKKPSAISRIASQFSDPRNVSKAVEAQKARHRTQAAYEVPANPTEETVSAIWSKLLAIDKVGRNDNFFLMGGHSLLATQMLARVRDTYNVELPLKALFESPVLASFAEKIESRRNSGAVVERPTPRLRGNTLPLSYAQQRLWFIDQLEPGSALYNVPQMYRMQGALKVDALEQALNEIVRRHEGLRTTFASVDGQPVQVIAGELRLPVRLMVVDEAEARRVAREEALRPFDLAQGPLLRATLLRLEEDEHVLLLTLHHIVSDGWSGNLLAAEMAALYEAFAQKRPSPLPELAIQYADYVVWQREWLQGEVLDQGVAYWRQHLAGAPAVLELPTDRPRPAVQRHRGAMRTHVIPRPLVDRLRSLSQAEGATLYMTLLAGFQLLLSRYSGQEDIVVGSTVAGRNYAEIEPLIGYFANTLALRSDLSGDPTFRELLARVKKVALDAYAHQEIPFEKLVEELQPERSLSYNPIFQVLFGLQNLPRQAYELSSLRVERMSVHPETSIFDMSWFAFEKTDGLLLRVEYDTDLYEDATIGRALGHYEKLLEGIAAHPESAISELPLLTAAELSQMVEWNATEAGYPRELCLHQLFERQAERSPDAVACVFDQNQLSYGELNQRANQLAHYLKGRGAGPGQRVGIFLERSLDMLVALLGVQKTGAAYVPLDPAYPAERLRLILEEAQAPLLVTESSLLESLPPHDSEIICLDRDGDRIARQERSNPPREGAPEDLVYVIFTSGSTGRPKGVQVPHRAVVNLLCCMTRQLEMGPEDVFPALASFAFDMCIPELYLPLVSGGRVAIGRRHLAGDGEELAAFLRRHGATIVHATPTTWDLLLEAGFTGRGLKRVIGAEALPQDLCDRLLEADASLYNYYGPTETTVWSTMHHFQSMDEPVVVGRPLANTQVYILDRRLRRVPVGVPGEIFIAGDGVTHGYLNEPELTAEKFLEDPFARSPGRKMYRTGDLGRFLADGRIEFWGRADNQVKIRGYRIELGEVEAALGQHPAVREAVVVAREDVPGDKRLVGYVVTVDQQAVPAVELRGFVKQKLPEYMVPVAWVQLERFPLTANGKVDRRNLPAPQYRRQDQEQEYVAPRTPAEEVIGGIWAEVLKLDRVGVEDNFFELGGHSLLGTQVVSRIRQTLGVELPLRALFEAPTVAGLAERITVYQREQQGMRAVPLQRVKRAGPLPLSYAQQRLWFIDQLEPGSALYNLPRPIRMSGALQADALEKALNDLVQRHEILRTTYGVENDQPVQVIASQLTIPLPLVDLSELPAAIREDQARRIVEEESGKTFNLAEGPMLRALLVRLGARDHILVLSTHHIASDGWSGGVLIRDLAAFYQAALEGKPASLPELTIQYADYAVWQRNWLQGEILEKRLTYWRSRLEGAPPVLTLPTDRPRPPVQTFRGATERSVLPKSLADDVLALSHQQGATTFMTLLAAFQSLLFYFSRQPDIVLGTDIANRTTVQTEDLIGFFVNLLVLRTDLSGDPSFAELLGRVREVALGAYAHQEIPFEKLVEELQPERTLSYNPLVQALFVEFNLPRGTFQMPGLELSWFKLQSPSKFDMAVFIGEGENGPGTTWLYNPDLFDASTVSRMMHLYQVALETVIVDPAIRLSALLERLSETEQRLRASEYKEFEEVSLQKLKKIKRRAAKEMST